MKTAYLIYRPVMDYEESEIPYCICLTKEVAEARRAEMVLFAIEVAGNLPKFPTTEHWEAKDQDREFVDCEARCGTRRAEIYWERIDSCEDIEWPYKIELSGDIRLHDDIASFDESSIQIRELPLV